jgi:sigma-B regulation protein RsbU (phosphoserine phosphatase)
MKISLKTRFSIYLRRLNRVDFTALALLVVCGALFGLHAITPTVRGAEFFLVLGIVAAIYLAVRGLLWAREYYLWSLRNRLVTAYIFIAVVPVLLLLTMAGLAAYLLYWQLGSYVLYTQMEEREQRVGAVAETMATSYVISAASGRKVGALVLPEDVRSYMTGAMSELPGLKIESGVGEELLKWSDDSSKTRFEGLVMSGGLLSVRAVVLRQTPYGRFVVSAIVPVTPELIDTLAPELGPIQFDVLRLTKGGANQEVSVVIGQQEYVRTQQIATRGRRIPRAANVFDKLIAGIVSLDLIDLDRPPGDAGASRVFASFDTRPSLLNKKLFGPLGELGGAAATALLIVGTVLLIIEIGSLATGIVLTRTITTAVGELYRATQQVQAGDFTFRVRIPHRDQLASLGESFNSMTQSVSMLIEEQRLRQRLENEIAIAHEVQLQLFPHALPKLPGVELEAICAAARTVSGDYYDFIRIAPTSLAVALADISGKGISAALLMASVQAALRSDVLRYRGGSEGKSPASLDTAEIVSHLNRHLFRNTSDERYATLFFGVYDTETRLLRYTNAGHLPPIYISNGRVTKLETGGMVVGLFNEVSFEQGTIEIEPGGLLFAYSDGLMESENVYGEEFGTERLIEVAIRNREASSHVIAEALMRAASEWSGSPEQADDMTVVVARFSEVSREQQA